MFHLFIHPLFSFIYEFGPFFFVWTKIFIHAFLYLFKIIFLIKNLLIFFYYYGKKKRGKEPRGTKEKEEAGSNAKLLR